MITDRKTVVVSGASSGIGFSLVAQLGKLGNVVFAGARREDDIVRLSSLENVRGVRLDITHPEDIFSLAQRITAEVGHIDVLVNNAGVPGWGVIMEREIEYFKRVMDVNLFGHVQMVQAFYPLLRKSDSHPIVINVSSQAGNYALPFWSAYHMSKWGLEAFSDCLRRELSPLGIRVAVIQPGRIKSKAFASQLDDFARYQSEKSSEFHARAIAWLKAAFNASPANEKDPQVVVKDILHAIAHENNRLYYQPGRRLIPDTLVAKLPAKLVDRVLAGLWSKAK